MMMVNCPRWSAVGYCVELSFDTRFNRSKTSCRFSVNRQFVPSNWSSSGEGTI